MNMQALLKQAQKMQQELGKAEAELSTKEYEASMGGGVVKVIVTGGMEVKKVEIEKELLTENGKEDLEDLLKSALNEALQNASKDKEKVMNGLTGGVKMPGGF